MASLIKTNKISTPGGEDFTLPTTYPASKSTLQSTSSGVWQYKTGGVSSDKMGSGSTPSVIGERFCDKVRVNNTVATPATVNLSLTPDNTSDVDNIAWSKLEFAGVCFDNNSGNNYSHPTIKLKDSSGTAILDSNFRQSYKKRDSYNAGNGSYVNNNSNASSNGFKLNYSYSIASGSLSSDEGFTKTAGWTGAGLLSGIVYIYCLTPTQNSAAGDINRKGMIRMISQISYRNDITFSNYSCYFTQNFSDFYMKSDGQTWNQATQLDFYDTNGNNINEGLFWTYSFLNPTKT
tara:strand:- start:3220 stop:4092 length:873 start_codon:yes stop_codon:yes gene_type:complete